MFIRVHPTHTSPDKFVVPGFSLSCSSTVPVLDALTFLRGGNIILSLRYFVFLATVTIYPPLWPDPRTGGEQAESSSTNLGAGDCPSPDEAKTEIGASRTVPCAFEELF